MLNLFDESGFNHQVDSESGVLEDECAELLKGFFAALRVRNREEKLQRKTSDSMHSQRPD